MTFDKIGQEIKAAAATRAKSTDDLLSQAMLPPLQLDLPDSAKSVEPRFDLAVSNAPASQVFMALVSGTRYSMLVSPDVTGNVTVNLKRVTVREALETIRELYGYEFKYQGTRIYIQSNAIQTRMFQINYLSSTRQGSSETRVSSNSGLGGASPQTGSNTGTSSTSSNPVVAAGSSPGGATGSSTGGTSSTGGSTASSVATQTKSDFWGILQTTLSTLVGKDGSFVINPQAGVIVIKALPAEIRSVEAYLKAAQVVVERQVMIEAKIIDVQLSEGFQAGVNWAAFKSGSNSRIGVGSVVGRETNLSAYNPTNPSSQALSNTTASVIPGQFGSIVTTALGKTFLGLAFQTANFAALLNFLETQGTVSVLSSPRIATLNNQKAIIKVGDDSFFVSNVVATPSTTGLVTTVTVTPTYSQFFNGISLDVTPQIDGEDKVVLHVHALVSKVTSDPKTWEGKIFEMANNQVKETDSIVRVLDGNIVAIGGLMTQDQDTSREQLPGTGNTPLATLFGKRSNSMNKRELVILLKPTIIRDDQSWVNDLEQTGERLRGLDPRQFNGKEQ
ncbi:secretin N-terminal domain-containing protein [Propionivibrio sp.]|uniref:secretin N-terminal domain-containing protein n=1 Tax=Propionivibrio sp. TaxID=2212460 RepID=UPI003BF26A51